MNKKLEIKGDERGFFVEVFKVPGVGQFSYSTTKKRGTVRGNHYHTHKIELFCVIEGMAKIRLRNRDTNEVKEYVVSGEHPELVEMTPNWTHNIENVGEGEMRLLIWANEIFDPQNPDTFPEAV